MVFDEENMVGNQHMVENDYKIKSSSTVKIWWQFSDVARINGEFEKNIDFNWLFLASKHGLIRNKYRCENWAFHQYSGEWLQPKKTSGSSQMVKGPDMTEMTMTLTPVSCWIQSQHHSSFIYPLEMTNIAIENGPVEIVDVHGFSH